MNYPNISSNVFIIIQDDAKKEIDEKPLFNSQFLKFLWIQWIRKFCFR